jgi:hypothetical protein
MIDAADAKVGRGYDFAAAVRWFAERADVVLLMFDPDKPGTTGETLQILKTALEGLDHKLLFVLNKVDRFGDIRDFARTYGALCWNLSKAIPRKDLPHIYNIYVPVPNRDAPAKDGLPLAAFDKARDEVIEEIRRAPSRRVDNVVSRLYEHARRLRVHAIVCDKARSEIWGARMRLGLLAVGALLLAGGVGMGLHAMFPDTPFKIYLATLGIGILLAAALVGFAHFDTQSREREILEGLDGLFERAFARELLLGERGDDLIALWKSVKDRTRRALETVGPRRAPKLWGGELRRIDRAIQNDIPALRAEGQA